MENLTTTELIKQLFENTQRLYKAYLSLFFIEQNNDGVIYGISDYNELLIKIRGLIQNESIILYYLSEKKEEILKILDNKDKNKITQISFYELIDNDPAILIKRRMTKQLWELVNHPGYKLIPEHYFLLSSEKNIIYLINYAFANLLNNNAQKVSGSIGLFFKKSKYIFAFLNPIIEKEMLNCRFGKENYGATMDLQLQDYYAKLALSQVTEYVKAFCDLNNNDKYLRILLVCAIQSTINYLSHEQKITLRDSILGNIFTKEYCETNLDAMEKIDYIKAIFDGNNLLEELKKDLL